MRVFTAVFLLLGLTACHPNPSPPPLVRSESQMQALLKDPNSMNRARMVYQNICSRCHGENGEGGLGPNLTDRFWIHGDGQLMSLIGTIQRGAPDKGMPAWEAISTQEEIELAAAHVFSLAGSQPKGAKAPQGEEKP